MKDKDKEDKQLQEAFDDLYRYVLIMGIKFNWQMIAATLVSIGLRIYKTILDDEGYQKMTESISDNFDKIDKFKDETLH
tara:strand:+ start:208 stop:444 length:237 start_codon:yes stop_codon:yes gene_type:complete